MPRGVWVSVRSATIQERSETKSNRKQRRRVDQRRHFLPEQGIAGAGSTSIHGDRAEIYTVISWTLHLDRSGLLPGGYRLVMDEPKRAEGTEREYQDSPLLVRGNFRLLDEAGVRVDLGRAQS
jgi:hypothetical protein